MAKLTATQVSNVYEEIGKMRVELDPNPNRGLQYVKERLTLCRAMQDRLHELLLTCNRALADVLTEELALKMEKLLTPSTGLEQRLLAVGGERQDHKLLTQMLKAQGVILRSTSMDIRLLADLTKEQIKLGEIDPHDAGLVEPTRIEDMVPSNHVTLADGSAILEGITGADREAGASEPTLNYEELFGVIHDR